MRFTNLKYILCLLWALCFYKSNAQVGSSARYGIDIKRAEMGLSNNYSSPEIILRAREFVRLDPSYYVGYMLEGFSRYDRSGDVLGYKLAIPTIKQAMELFEKDYGFVLRNVYSSRENFNEYRERLFDYIYIVDKLMDCYSNIERPDSVIHLLNHYKSWNFSHDVLGADNYIAWTYHRNRFYTSQNFSFLKNSVAENEQMAMNYLKNNLIAINKNASRNEEALSYSMVMYSKMSVYHYLAILYSYVHKPDSARMYYEYMQPYSIFPYNNYAIFCFINGNFSEARMYFSYSGRTESADKYRLKESAYYQTILDVMAGKPQQSVYYMTDLISNNGVRPGWGWYNLGLARAMMYNGQLDSSMIAINKASKFKEIHIGTTWGESHYSFSTTILKLMNLEKQVAAIKFEDRNYMLSPAKLKKIAELKLDEYATRIALFNQLSSNPEREEVFYRLFASEATVSFDEVFHMVKDYGRNFFINKFETLAKEDEREGIRRYFSLLQGKLYIEKGRTKKSLEILKELEPEAAEEEHEKLFAARLYEALAISNKESGSDKEFQNYRNQFYTTFPQLVPYSKIKMKFVLEVKNTNNAKGAEKIVDDLKSFNIDFIKKYDETSPKVILQFYNNGTKDAVTCSVESAWGSVIVEPKTITYKSTDDVAKKIAYTIFNVGATATPSDYDIY